MSENQRKWLRSLRDKGVKFDFLGTNETWVCGISLLSFSSSADHYGITAQPIPDIPEWREVCREMHSKGVEFEHHAWAGIWNKSIGLFDSGRENYRIPQQPIPEWKEEPHPIQYLDALQDRPEIQTKANPEKSFKMGRKEEMTEETKPEPPEIPHRDLQIQWHEDWIHHLKTGEPMREWEYKNSDEWITCPGMPAWSIHTEYRRKPRKVRYWHCVVVYNTPDYNEDVFTSNFDDDEVQAQIDRCKEKYPTAKFSPIIETTAELED